MAGNVSAFSTVWTYDIYGAFLNKKASDKHYVSDGALVDGDRHAVSVGTAYLVAHAASIMDYVQALFSFFIAPLFGTVLLGMLWKRATKAGGFWGLVYGASNVPKEHDDYWYQKPIVWASMIAVVFVVLNVIFW
jgi:SSS family solute:Na+ symporter